MGAAGARDELEDFNALYRRAWNQVRAVARRIVRDDQVAQEIAQEAFTRLFDRWPKLRKHPNPDALVQRAAINLALNHVARRKVEVAARVAPDHQDHKANQLVVWQAVKRLSDKQRDAVTYTYLLDFDQDRTAEAMGVGVGTVKTHLGRAKDALRKSLGDQLEDLLRDGS